MPLEAVCLLKKSDEYDVDYVDRLTADINGHLGLPLRCIEDDRWSGRFGWCKMALFAPEIKGDVLYFDLDTIIVGDLSDIASVGCLTMLSDFNVPNRLASGLMYLREDDRAAVWEEWIKDPAGIMAKQAGWGDGGFIGDVLPHAARWQNILPGQVVSYKNHVRKGKTSLERGNGEVPPDARVVCFHGRPRPRDINWKI